MQRCPGPILLWYHRRQDESFLIYGCMLTDRFVVVFEMVMIPLRKPPPRGVGLRATEINVRYPG